jgi:hypothetical protein
MKQALRLGIFLVSTIGLGPSLHAAGGPPDAATLLFEENQLEAAPPGATLVYDYSRKTVDDARYGASFDDQVRLMLAAGSRPESRTVDMELFTGPRRLPTGTFANMTGNPLLSVFLELHVKVLSEKLHANPRYLKNAIRAALRDRAELSEARLEVASQSHQGWHVRITPFRDDANRGRMLGLDSLVYDFSIAKDVPGEIVEIHVEAPAPQGPPLLDERIAFDAETK